MNKVTRLLLLASFMLAVFGTASAQVSPLSATNPVEYKGTQGMIYVDGDDMTVLPLEKMWRPYNLIVAKSVDAVKAVPQLNVTDFAWRLFKISEVEVGKIYPIKINNLGAYNVEVLGSNVIKREPATFYYLRCRLDKGVEVFLQYEEDKGVLCFANIGTKLSADYFITKPVTPGAKPINLAEYKLHGFNDSEGNLYPASGNEFGPAFILTTNPDQMRSQIKHVSGPCVGSEYTNTSDLVVGKIYPVRRGDPWDFQGIYRGVHTYLGVKVAFFQVGVYYLSYVGFRVEDNGNINAIIYVGNKAIVPQIQAKRAEAKKLRAKADQLDSEADQLLPQITQ